MKWVWLLISGLATTSALADVAEQRELTKQDPVKFQGAAKPRDATLRDTKTPADETKLRSGPADGIIVAGQLNPGFHERAAALEAKVLEVRDAPDNTHLIKIELIDRDAIQIWATTFVPLAEGQVKIGDRLIFKGYIATTDSIDSTGRLRGLTEGSAAVLRARTIESPK